MQSSAHAQTVMPDYRHSRRTPRTGRFACGYPHKPRWSYQLVFGRRGGEFDERRRVLWSAPCQSWQSPIPAWCCSSCPPIRRADEHFAAESVAARDAGHNVGRIDHDALAGPDGAGRAVARVPDGGGAAVYRGWMLNNRSTAPRSASP